MLLYVKNLNISESVWLYFFTFIFCKAELLCYETIWKLASQLHHVKQNVVNLRDRSPLIHLWVQSKI